MKQLLIFLIKVVITAKVLSYASLLCLLGIYARPDARECVPRACFQIPR